MTVEITPEFLNELERAITPAGKDGDTRMTYLLENMSDEFNSTTTPDIILALIKYIRAQAGVIAEFEFNAVMNGDEEDTAS